MSRIDDVVANYQEERDHYLSLLDDAPPARVLLFKGESGSGKSTLLTHCLHDFPCPEAICRVVIDFKGGRVNLPKLFNELGREIGWEHLPTFQARLNAVTGTEAVTIDRNRLLGWGNQITVFLSPEDQSVRASRLAALSEDLLTDLRGLPQPILLILDTYEQATDATREWIEMHLLDWLDKVTQLRVLIAGQTVPEATLKWGRLSLVRHLRGVPDPQHWLPVASRVRPHQSLEERLDWLTAICQVLDGQPSKIMQFIEALPGE